MATRREVERALRSAYPDLMATGLLKLGEDSHRAGGKAWWFEFRSIEDNGTEINLGAGYVHSDGLIEGLYRVEFTLDEYLAHETKCVPSETGGRGDHCAPTCECPCHPVAAPPAPGGGK